jgi:hypothetical protein
MSLHYCITALLIFFLLAMPTSSRQENVFTGKFSERALSSWKEKQFNGKTQYSFYNDEKKGWVIQAQSEGSASALLSEISVNIGETPYLNWSWRVDALPEVKDEKTKEGDDYSARIYVIFKTGGWFWSTKALNYVWNSSHPIGEIWPNAFSANTQMIALQSKSSPLGVWVAEKRNIQKDILDCFGVELTTIDAIAIMTDTDNSGSSAVAYYGDIFFTSE